MGAGKESRRRTRSDTLDIQFIDELPGRKRRLFDTFINAQNVVGGYRGLTQALARKDKKEAQKDLPTSTQNDAERTRRL